MVIVIAIFTGLIIFAIATIVKRFAQKIGGK
jgi:hypothetical protein